jgi:hypothetical protein
MLRNKLDALSLIHPRFRVAYTVDNAPSAWAGFRGLTPQAFASVLPPATLGDKTMILVSGGFEDDSVNEVLSSMKYDNSQVRSF